MKLQPLALARPTIDSAALSELALLHGDIEQMGPHQRVSYYMRVCDSVGLNPWTKPFAFIRLNGKTVLYALKDCTEQLRRIHGVSLVIKSRELVDGVFVVTAHATDKHGRTDESIGAVPTEGVKGEGKANAMMKAETKSKRRVTLSICGLGFLDESETDSIPGAEKIDIHIPTKEEMEAGAAEIEPIPEADDPNLIDRDEAKAIGLLALNDLKWAKPKAQNWLKKYFGVEKSTQMTKAQGADARSLLEHLIGGKGDETAYLVELSTLQELGRVLRGDK